MKKFLFFLIALCIAVTACTNEDPGKQHNEANSTQTDIFAADSTINQLICLNDSLISSVPASRKINYFRYVCEIAYADIKGAVEGYKAGSTFGPAGSWICSVFYGTGASAMAFWKAMDAINKNPQTGPKSIISSRDIEDMYYVTVMDSNFTSNRLEQSIKININIPEDYVDAERLGQIHNLMLHALQNRNVTLTDVDAAFSDEERAVLRSPRYQAGFNNYMSNANSFSLNYNITNPNAKEERIVQHFLNLYKNYPADKDDVNYIVNRYIYIIEHDSSITQTQKKVVYTALAMAAYSSSYWDNQLN